MASLGVLARVLQARVARTEPTPAEVAALDSQIARVDSARREGRRSRSSQGTVRSASSASRGTGVKPAVPRPLVDLDVADLATIEALPWIGPSIAARIVESRERCGAFGSLEALERVYGVGAGTTRRLAPYVTFSGRSRPMRAASGSGCSVAVRDSASHRRGRP